MPTKGTIVEFRGSWGSGIAELIVETEDGIQAIPCDNAPLVRLLDGVFGNVISEGHTVNNDAIRGEEIYFGMDDMGLCLGWICPADEFDEDVFAEYEEQ